VSLKSEIFEQPAVLARLLESQLQNVRRLARAIRAHEVDYVFVAARGTSDNAALYAKYLWATFNRLPIALAAPSLFTIYGSPPALHRALVVGISQSGQSPDIVGVVEEGRRQGAPTLAITNDPASPLAQAAEFVVDVCAGPEMAVAATKTYTAQLMAIAILSVAACGQNGRLEELERVPDLVQEALSLDPVVEQAAERYRYVEHCVVLGRGYNYATAHEWSLKLKELAHVIAEPYSSADLQHGPVALISHGFPVLAVAPGGAVFDDMLTLTSSLVAESGVELVAVSDREEMLSLAHTGLRLPRDLPEWVSPLVSIVPAQLFCYHLTRARGYDTESPRGLKKITRTK
jgi:glucosamine--fructose-6-phosphate aminotransferase (isomerizing)